MISHKPSKHNFMRTMTALGKGLKSIDNSMSSTQTSFNKIKLNSEKAKFKAHIEDVEKFSNSTHKDFTQLIRPATAIGGYHEIGGSTGSSGGFTDDMTRPNSSWKRARMIKPSEMLHKKGSSKLKDTFWFERAEKILLEVENTSKILDNVDYM